jgi:hypothetical protein
MLNFFIFGHGCYDASRPSIALGRNVLFFKSPKNSSTQACAVDQDVVTANYPYKVGGVSGASVEEYIIDFVDDVDTYGFASFDVIAYDASTGFTRSLNYHTKTGVYLSDILNDINQTYGGSHRIYLTVCRGPCEEAEDTHHDKRLRLHGSKCKRHTFQGKSKRRRRGRRGRQTRRVRVNKL